jgi:tetratricopeptide (TPR) repeat protein
VVVAICIVGYTPALSLWATDEKGHLWTFEAMNQSNSSGNGPSRRLDSWKEIAHFFNKDVRTVRRWEKERELPVHRARGKPGGSVYAFTGELTEWLNSPSFSREETAVPEETNSSQWVTTLLIASAALIVIVAIAIGWYMHTQGAQSAAPSKSVRNGGSANPEAVDLYLKGRFEWNQRSPESLNRAVDFFTQAIVRDPNYAQAYAGLADTYNLLREYTVMPGDEAYPRAIAAAKKAVELDDSLSEAHRALAFATFYWTWDFPGAEHEFKRAIELNPKDSTAHHWYATSLLSLSRFTEALSEIEQARQLDPGSVSILADRALILFYANRKEESAALFRQIETHDPTFLSPHRYQAQIALVKGDYRTYILEYRKTMELTHDSPGLDIAREEEQGYAKGGGEELLRTLLQAQMKSYDRGTLSAFSLAETCALLGKQGDAIRYLQEDFAKHDPAMVDLQIDLALMNLHDDPAFRALVSKVGLPPITEQFKASSLDVI